MFLTILKFSKKTVISVSGATLLAIASFLFVGSAEAQASAIQVFPDSIVNNGTNSVNVFVDTSNFENIPWADYGRNGAKASADYYSTSCRSGASIGTNLTGVEEFNNSSFNHISTSACTASGFYYTVYVNLNATSTQYYLKYYWDSVGQTITYLADPLDEFADSLTEKALLGTYATRFLSATITASTTLSVDVNYYIDTTDFLGQFDRPDIILVNVSNTSANQFETKQKLILPLSTGTSTKTINLVEVIPDGDYTMQINFWNLASQKFVLNRSALAKNFTVSGGVVTSQTVVDISDGLFPEDEYIPEDCGITSLSGCFNNSARFLFYPSSDSITYFLSVKDSLDSKTPFIYLGQMSSIVTSLYSGGSTTIPSLSIPFGPYGNLTLISESMVTSFYYVTLLKTLMAAGIWVLLARNLYRRAMQIHDNVTV